MSEVKVTHQGYEISYAENENVWRCWRLNVEGPSLSIVKQKINKMIAKALKNLDIDCYILSRYGGSEIDRARITSRDAKTGEFWTIKADSERRERIAAKYLLPWTPEIEATLAEVKRIEAEGSKLYREAAALKKTIKPLTADEVEAFLTTLVKTVQDEAE